MNSPFERKEMNQAYRGGLAAGSITTIAFATLVATLVNAKPDDPLKPVLNPDATVSPDKLAEDIAKDPKLQERWKAMREFVQSLDQKVGKNLEQTAGGSLETAKNWKHRVDDSKKDSHGQVPPG